MDKAKRAADMLSGALSLLGEDADSAEARGRLGLPPADGAFGEEEPGSVVQRAMQQVAPRPAGHSGLLRHPRPPSAGGCRRVENMLWGGTWADVKGSTLLLKLAVGAQARCALLEWSSWRATH
jgi:hypothetical protein